MTPTRSRAVKNVTRASWVGVRAKLARGAISVRKKEYPHLRDAITQKQLSSSKGLACALRRKPAKCDCVPPNAVELDPLGAPGSIHSA